MYSGNNIEIIRLSAAPIIKRVVPFLFRYGEAIVFWVFDENMDKDK